MGYRDHGQRRPHAKANSGSSMERCRRFLSPPCTVKLPTNINHLSLQPLLQGLRYFDCFPALSCIASYFCTRSVNGLRDVPPFILYCGARSVTSIHGKCKDWSAVTGGQLIFFQMFRLEHILVYATVPSGYMTASLQQAGQLSLLYVQPSSSENAA